jgi:hypothetical protein
MASLIAARKALFAAYANPKANINRARNRYANALVAYRVAVIGCELGINCNTCRALRLAKLPK